MKWIASLALLLFLGCNSEPEPVYDPQETLIKAQREYISELRTFLMTETCKGCRLKWQKLERELAGWK